MRFYVLFVYVLEYKTAKDAESASSFLTIDLGYPKILIDGVKVIGFESETGSHYIIPSENFFISIRGDTSAAKESMNELIKMYKK